MCEFKSILWKPLQDNRAATMAKMKTGKSSHGRDLEQDPLLWLMEQSWKFSSTGSQARTQESVHPQKRADARAHRNPCCVQHLLTVFQAPIRKQP